MLLLQTIAELFESQTADLDKAMQHYEQAAEYFRGEESHSSANKCMLKVAANRSIGEVVQSRRRPLLGPSPG